MLRLTSANQGIVLQEDNRTNKTNYTTHSSNEGWNKEMDIHIHAKVVGKGIVLVCSKCGMHLTIKPTST